MMTELLAGWNPWWKLGKVPDALKMMSRTVDPLLFRSLDIREITILTGIRRSGKTTLMYQMIDMLLTKTDPAHVLYVNFDDPALRGWSLEEIYREYRRMQDPGKKAFIFLDEVQHVPEWERFLKKYYDMGEDVKFVVSGSSSSLLVGEYATLLTGRNLTFRIYPLSFREFLGFSGVDAGVFDAKSKDRIIHLLNRYLEIGGFPGAFFKDDSARKPLLEQYFTDILYRDVIFRHAVVPSKITDLAVYLLTNIAKPFTARQIRSFTGLSMDSVRQYIEYLRESFLLVVTSHFSYSLKESLHFNRPKKAYCIDAGLRNVVGFTFSADLGRLAENAVCVELSRKNRYIYYWSGKGEVDFIVKNANGSLVAINVTFGAEIDGREVKSLLEFKNRFKSRVKEMLVLTRDIEKEEGGVRFIPLWKWLLE